MKSNFFTYKHMRGRHDQRDHAWNRGMGRGGSVDSSGEILRAPVSILQYREQRRNLAELVRKKVLTRTEMRQQLSDLQLKPLPTRREQAAQTISYNRNFSAQTIKRDPPQDGMPNPVAVEEIQPGGKLYEIMADAYRKASTESPYIRPYTENMTFSELTEGLGKRESQSIIYDIFGFNAKPQVRKWDDMTGENVHEIHQVGPFYRGVTDTDGKGGPVKTGSEIQDELRYGEKHWVGFGINGFGTYSTTNEELADEHAGRKNRGSAIVKLEFAQDAIIDDGKEFGQTERALINRYGWVDQGILMILAGFDGYVTREEIDRNGKTWLNMNILNRGKLIVSEETKSTLKNS